jgi:hypothetical protein
VLPAGRVDYINEEDGVLKVRGIVLAITGALAVSGIAAAPASAQAGRSAKCDPTGGPYPGYVGPYAYAAYYYGYPPDCGGISFQFFSSPAYSGYRYSKPRYVYHRRRGSNPHQ